MIGVGATTVGIERLKLKLTRRVNFLSVGIQPILKSNGDKLVQVFQDKIQTFTPGEVPDLAESTKKEKARYGDIYPILIRTREFFNSMYSVIRRPVRGSGWAVAIGFRGSHSGGITNERLAEIHIKGEGRMPARDFTQVPRAWARGVVNDIRQALRRL